MKVLISLLFISLTICQGQNIPAGATKVQVISSLSDSLLFTNTSRFLTGQDWGITSKDIRRKTLTTDYADLHHEKEYEEAWRVRMLITIQNSVVTFRSWLYLHGPARSIENQPVAFTGLDDDVYKTAFRRMAEAARQFAKDVPDGELRYPTQ